MAYAKSKDIEILQVAKNNRGDYIRVCRIVPDDKSKLESIDIRNMYTDDDGEVKPTTKGIRLNSEIATEVLAAALASMPDDEYYETIDKALTMRARRPDDEEDTEE